MYEITIRTKIKCSVDDLFRFHQDTNNLPLITPQDMKVNIIELHSPMKEGNIVKLAIKKFGITQNWEVRIAKIEQNLIKDIAIKSPFRYFEHDHIFESIDENYSFLIDNIKFRLPFEPFSKVAYPFVKADMLNMFTYRHAMTKKILEGDLA